MKMHVYIYKLILNNIKKKVKQLVQMAEMLWMFLSLPLESVD